MTTEEKARAYDEALKDMGAIYPNLKGDAKLAVEHAFPELKESEDERMLRTIIRGFENWKGNGNVVFNNTKVDDILAYLEKQKEQKPAEWSEEDEKMRDRIIDILNRTFSVYSALGTSSTRPSCPTYKDEIAWLKSLRPSWKPSEEEPDKSLEAAAEEYASDYHAYNDEQAIAKYSFKRGAEWQASQMPMPEDTVLFQKGVAEGRRLEREDMLKDAVESESDITEAAKVLVDSVENYVRQESSRSTLLSMKDKLKELLEK